MAAVKRALDSGTLPRHGGQQRLLLDRIQIAQRVTSGLMRICSAGTSCCSNQGCCLNHG